MIPIGMEVPVSWLRDQEVWSQPQLGNQVVLLGKTLYYSRNAFLHPSAY